MNAIHQRAAKWVPPRFMWHGQKCLLINTVHRRVSKWVPWRFSANFEKGLRVARNVHCLSKGSKTDVSAIFGKFGTRCQECLVMNTIHWSASKRVLRRLSANLAQGIRGVSSESCKKGASAIFAVNFALWVRSSNNINYLSERCNTNASMIIGNLGTGGLQCLLMNTVH